MLTCRFWDNEFNGSTRETCGWKYVNSLSWLEESKEPIKHEQEDPSSSHHEDEITNMQDQEYHEHHIQLVCIEEQFKVFSP